jgi:hypothetical protein
MNTTLYLTPDNTRYFLIPDGEALPAGDFAIRTFAGDTQSVDPAALAAFEIAERQAKQYVHTDMSQTLEQVKSAVSGFLAMASLEAQKHKAAPAASAQPAQPVSGLVTSLLGLPPEELRQDPELLKERLSSTFAGFKTFLENTISEDSAQLEAAREQTRALRAMLEQHGVQTNEEMDRIPDKVRAAFFSPERAQERKQLAQALQELAGQVTQTAAGVSERLQAQATELQNKSGVNRE